MLGTTWRRDVALVGEAILKWTVGLVVAMGWLVSGCLTRDSEVYASGVIDGPRVVAMSGARRPWIIEIEKRLREKGFTIKRFESVTEVSERAGPGRVETSQQATARVILRIEASAPNTAMTRCFGGGFNFDYINAEVIDAKTNETLASYSNAGYSEGCPPLGKPIFADIVNNVEVVFKK
jgi:hypothetical protein